MATPVAVSQHSDMERVAAQVDRSPTLPQKEAGNYKKGHMLWRGLSISIENPAFSQRTGIGPDGREWSVTLPYHYGYIRRTVGADGDQVDCMIGPNLNSTRIFVVDQVNPKTWEFDETKVFIGYLHKADVENSYDAGFSDGSGPVRRAMVTEVGLGAFRRWLRNGDTTKPFSRQLQIDLPKLIAEHARDKGAAEQGPYYLGKYNHNHGANGEFTSSGDYQPAPWEEFRHEPEHFERPHSSGNMYARDVPDEIRQQYEDEINAGGVQLGVRYAHQAKQSISLPESKPVTSPKPKAKRRKESVFTHPLVVAGLGGIGAGILMAGAGKLAERLLHKDDEAPTVVPQTPLVTGTDNMVLNPSQRMQNWKKRMRFMRYSMKKSLQDDKYVVNLPLNKSDLLKAGERLSERILGKASLSPDEIASGIEASLGSGLASFFSWLQGKPANDVSQAASQYNPDAAVNALNTDEFNQRLNDSLNPLDAAFAGGIRYASNSNLPPSDQGKQVRVAFNAGTPYTQQALENYKIKLAGDISQSQQDTIRQIVLDGTNQGLPPAKMAQSIRDVIGLTANQAQNVVNYRDSLENINQPGNAQDVFGRQLRDQRYDRVVQQAIAQGQDIPPAQIDKMVDAYKRRYIAYRAMNIARTESMKAVNLGAVSAAEDYADLNNLDVVKKWIATMDPRTRKEHRELNGQEIVGMDNPFTVSDGRTILYPHDPDADPELTINCRCALGLSYVPKQDTSEEDVSGE